MSQNITIVTYHYVRDLKHTRYPGIKGLETELFREQLAYFKKYHTLVSAYDLIDHLKQKRVLPKNALLLTFDDGYSDHFNTVFPILNQEGFSGCFFPPARCILENTVLDVNKIQFILACIPDPKTLVTFILNALDEERIHYNLESNDYYIKKERLKRRFDNEDITFVKSMLQVDLPRKLREKIIDQLFSMYVSHDERTFSQELYMSIDQITCLQRNGMYIGSHGYSHEWLDSIPPDEQKREIDISLDLLQKTGCNTEHWIMSYPYGAYNESLLSIIKEKGCIAGLTTNMNVANLSQENPLTLSRLDTQDLPQDRKAGPHKWTLHAIQ